MPGKDTKVGIIGFGYVGLTLGAFLSDRGFDVVGVDTDKRRVEDVNRGKAPIEEPGIPDLVEEGRAEDRLAATTDYRDLEDRDVVLVTVGTPLDEDYDPDLDAVRSVARTLADHLPNGANVILKSTVVPGTTEEFARLIEEESGMEAGEDYVLSYSPERLAEGTALSDLRSTPVVVGGHTPEGTEQAIRFFEDVGLETHRVSGAREAELTKLACNLWIDLNIALANELALLSEEEGADVFEVVQAANTLPKGDHNVNILYPGAGVGGSCLTKDPWFVEHRADDQDVDLLLPSAGRRANDKMPHHVADVVEDNLSKPIEEARVAVLGLAFKSDTDDMRATPAKPLIADLEGRGATVIGYDPLVDRDRAREVTGSPVAASLEDALQDADAAVVVTVQEEYAAPDWNEIAGWMEASALIVDGRNATNPHRVREAGLRLRKIGVGASQEERR